jgi:hypothetical protein
MKTFADEHTDELLTMLKSFRWLEQMRPVLTYTLTLPEDWEFVEGDEELAVYVPKSNTEDDDNAPLIFVINFKVSVEQEMREDFLTEFFLKEETKTLLGTEDVTIDSHEATLYLIEDIKEDGRKVVNLVCLIYTDKATYGIMSVQSEVVTLELFKNVFNSWKLVK